MPYVEGFGTWPFGEEWLWEAVGDVLRAAAGRCSTARAAPLTLSLTPVLADQLEAPGVHERLLALPARPARRHRTRSTPRAAARAASRRWPPSSSAPPADYARAADRLEALGDGDLPAALAPPRGVDLQLRPTPSCRCSPPTPACACSCAPGSRPTAPAARRRARRLARRLLAARVRATRRGCDPLLEEAGVHATCVDLTDVLARRADAAARRQRRAAAGPDRPRGDRARVERRRLPGRRRLPRLAPPDRPPPPSVGQRRRRLRPRPGARAGARDARTSSRACAERVAGGGLCGLRARHRAARPLVVRGAGLAGRGARRGAARAAWRSPASTTRCATTAVVAAPDDLPETSWGTPRTLSTWDGPQVAELAFAARAAELRTVARPRRPRATPVRSASCWRCSPATGRSSSPATSPAHIRASGPRRTSRRWTPRWTAPGTQNPALRDLAPFADPSMLLVP